MMASFRRQKNSRSQQQRRCLRLSDIVGLLHEKSFRHSEQLTGRDLKDGGVRYAGTYAYFRRRSMSARQGVSGQALQLWVSGRSWEGTRSLKRRRVAAVVRHCRHVADEVVLPDARCEATR